MNKNGNLILTSLMEADTYVKEVSSIPEGYIEVKLSTNGKVGAPSVVHVRNFKVSEIISLSLSGNSDLPIRLISILNDMILEDTDVFNWHEKEIEELMVYIFLSFYKPILTDVPFPFTDEDFKQLVSKKKMGWDIIKDECPPYDIEGYSIFKWKDRYNALDPHTTFVRNLFKISDIFWHTESNEEFRIKCDLNGIKEEDVNFYIVWNYNTPGYEFPYNWRITKYDPNDGYIESYTKFNMLTEMFEDISKNNKPMSTYDEFVSTTYDDCSYDK